MLTMILHGNKEINTVDNWLCTSVAISLILSIFIYIPLCAGVSSIHVYSILTIQARYANNAISMYDVDDEWRYFKIMRLRYCMSLYSL